MTRVSPAVSEVSTPEGVGYRETSPRRPSRTPKRSLTFDEFVSVYSDRARLRVTPRTLALNLAILGAFREHACRIRRSHEQLYLGDLSAELVESYVRARWDAKTSPWTINRDLGALSTFLSHAVRLGHLEANPIFKVDRLPVPRNRIPRTLRDTEITRLVMEASRPVPFHGRGGKGQGNARPRVTPLADMILFALNVGARLGEMLYLEWTDVDLDARRIHIVNKPEHRLKDLEDRLIPANQLVIEILTRRESSRATRWVFSGAGGCLLSRANALRELKIVAERAQLPWVNWQVLRRTFLTACASHGMPPFALKTLAGHSSIRTTERYYIGALSDQWMPPVIG